MEKMIIRPYVIGDESEIAKLVADTMRISNQGDYSQEDIEKMIIEYHRNSFRNGQLSLIFT